MEKYSLSIAIIIAAIIIGTVLMVPSKDSRTAKDLCFKQGFDQAKELDGVWYCTVDKSRGYQTERLDVLYPSPAVATAEQK